MKKTWLMEKLIITTTVGLSHCTSCLSKSCCVLLLLVWWLHTWPCNLSSFCPPNKRNIIHFRHCGTHPAVADTANDMVIKQIIRGSIRKFPNQYCCSCLSGRWEGRPRSHFHKPIASVGHLTLRCEHALFLHKSFFGFMFHFVWNGTLNSAMCLHQILREDW
jgi:hypothetical protein